MQRLDTESMLLVPVEGARSHTICLISIVEQQSNRAHVHSPWSATDVVSSMSVELDATGSSVDAVSGDCDDYNLIARISFDSPP